MAVNALFQVSHVRRFFSWDNIDVTRKVTGILCLSVTLMNRLGPRYFVLNSINTEYLMYVLINKNQETYKLVILLR